MNIDDVLGWIAKKEAEIALTMSECSNEEWKRLKGVSDILGALRLHILIKTNPHNREDIERIKDSYE